MSKGTPIRTLRIPPDLAAEIDATIKRRNQHSTAEPWHWSAFVLTTIRREIRKMARSRAPRGARPRAGAVRPSESP